MKYCGLSDVPHIPVVCSCPTHVWDQLSNYGKALKILIPNYNRNTICGWSNPKGKVISKNIIERAMGNRVAKSEVLSVKVQRVYGSYIKLRCILTDFKRNYHTLICSNLNTMRPVINRRSYNTTNNLYPTSPARFVFVLREFAPVHETSGKKLSVLALDNRRVNLNPWFVTGFTDAEGCFYLAIRNKKGKYYCEPSFIISLHKRDLPILEDIKNFFGVGGVYKHGKDSSKYIITSVKQLSTVISHFDNYPLITQKYADYYLFKMAVNLIKNKDHLTTEGLEKVVAIRKSLNLGLSSELKMAFPKLALQIPRESNFDQTIQDPNWMAGFTAGEGCFMIKVSKSPISKLGVSISLIFQITQHIRDESLLTSFITYFGCGTLVKILGENKVNYQVTKFSEIYNTVLPFFKNYQIKGEKYQNFKDWCTVAELIQTKSHLSKEGLDEILSIKSGFNRNRE